MNKLGTLNSEICKILADLGHTDLVVIADCGLPVPAGVKKIDLALKLGVPSFADVTAVVAEAMQVEHIIVAEELSIQNPETYTKLKAIFPKVPESAISHEKFKLLCQSAKAIIRTGEATPYANVILRAGVIF